MYCDICRQFPHHPRCPNAPDPPVVYYCDLCNEEIREGDEYYDFGKKKYCYNCVQEAFRTAEIDGEILENREPFAGSWILNNNALIIKNGKITIIRNWAAS